MVYLLLATELGSNLPRLFLPLLHMKNTTEQGRDGFLATCSLRTWPMQVFPFGLLASPDLCFKDASAGRLAAAVALNPQHACFSAVLPRSVIPRGPQQLLSASVGCSVPESTYLQLPPPTLSTVACKQYQASAPSGRSLTASHLPVLLTLYPLKYSRPALTQMKRPGMVTSRSCFPRRLAGVLAQRAELGAKMEQRVVSLLSRCHRRSAASGVFLGGGSEPRSAALFTAWLLELLCASQSLPAASRVI